MTHTAAPRPPLLATVHRAVLAGLVLIGLAMAFSQRGNLGDDALITLTYSKNLMAGNGFVFNQGAATLGTTTPLLAMLVALGGLFVPFLELPTVAVLIGGASWTGVAVLLYWRRSTWQLSPWGALGVGLVVVSTMRLGLIGMESALFAFLLIAAMTLFLEEQWLWAGLTTGLLFLTRGEGVLLVPVLLAARLVQLRSVRDTLPSAARLLTGAAAPVVLWAAYALVAIGTVVPTTLDAKKAQLASQAYLSFADRLWDEWLPLFGKELVFGPIHAFRILVAIGVVVAVVRHPRRLLLVAWFAAYVIGYTLLDVAGYVWYQETLRFVSNLFLGFGAVAVVTWVHRRHRLAGLAAATVATVVAVNALLLPTLRVSQSYTGPAEKNPYLTLADWLVENTSPSDRIGYYEVGFLGYHTNNEIVDLSGLVTPDAIPYIAQGDHTGWFWQERPEIFIHRPAFAGRVGGLLEDPCFVRTYQVVHRQPAPRPDAGELLVHRRVSDERCEPLAS